MHFFEWNRKFSHPQRHAFKASVTKRRLLASTARLVLAASVFAAPHAAAQTVTLGGDTNPATAAGIVPGTDLTIGDSSTGSMVVMDGGQVSNADAMLGAGSGGHGNVLISGDGSSWNNSGRLTVGAFGTGSLRIEHGARVENGLGIVGSAAEGDVVVTGANTTWVNRDALAVGNHNVGTLLVEDRATVTSSQGFVGGGGPTTASSTVGTVTVTGPGSSWSTVFDITVGNFGTGTLIVEDGALVHAGSGIRLASSIAGDSGTLVVHGTDTARTVLETSRIGRGNGAASVTIDGGLVRATQDNADFINDFGTHEFAIGSGGAIFDSNGHEIGIGAGMGGAGALIKTGLGVLTLSGNNAYTGGTAIEGGTVRISSDANLGSAAGRLSLDGGTLNTTADVVTGRGVDLIGAGTFLTDAGTTATLTGSVSGAGSLAKDGDGTLVIAGAATHSGGTTIRAGTLQLGDGGVSGRIVGDVANDATLAFNRSDALTFGGVISGTGALQQIGAGTTVLTGANVYSGGTTIAAGMLQLGDGGVSGSIVGDVVNDGTLAFNRSDAVSFDSVISGAGSIRQIGSGTTHLTGDSNGFAGTTAVEAGTLSVNGVLGGTMHVLSGRLQGIGTVGGTTNEAGGMIAPGNSIGTLTINGNYLGNGGGLEIEAALGGDTSLADRLVVTADTAGATRVTVLNQGGTGAPTVEGIKVIEVGGASNGSFALANGDYLFQGQDAIVAGAYAYTLQKNGVSAPDDGDWYLRSSYTSPDRPTAPDDDPTVQPIYQPGVPLYEAYGQVLQSLNRLPTLRQRVGDRLQDDAGAITAKPGSQAIWARIEGAHRRVTPRLSTSGTSYEIDSWNLQAGVEGQLLASSAGTLIGGLTAHHGAASADVASVFGHGKIESGGSGFGGTLTWYGQSGVYADAQAHANWFDSDLTSTTSGRKLADGKAGFGYALGLELGQRMALGGAWSLTPQAQLTYSRVDADSFTDSFGARVALQDADSLRGRLGLAADYRTSWRDSSGQMVGAAVYSIADLHYEFLDGNVASVSGTRFAIAEERLWGGLGLGAQYDRGRYSLYGDINAKTGLASIGDGHEISGRVGFRMSW